MHAEVTAPQAARARQQNHPRDLLKLMRPHQWAKNAFVFIGLIFGHAWNSPPLVVAAVLAATAFSLTASAIYIVNDYSDRARDLLHPSKRHRPLASRRVGPRAALGLAAILALIGGALALAAGKYVLLVVASYAAMNLVYSFGLKSVVILDIFVIAAGFMLRILAGTLGIGILPSQWLLFCGFLLTLFLGFTKRRAETLSLSAGSLTHRDVLSAYSTEMLDKLISICAGCVIMSYSLYTMSPDTARIHGTSGLIYTVPFVIYGIFRYLYLLHRKGAGTDTARDLGRDPHMLVVVAVWLVTTFWLISG
jgi:4-hydroxybenzoate polyprenyltransferase